MRPSITRLTLRGAQRLAASPTTSSVRVAPRRALPRELCSSTAVPAEAKRNGGEQEGKEHVKTGTVESSSDVHVPSMQILTDDNGTDEDGGHEKPAHQTDSNEVAATGTEITRERAEIEEAVEKPSAGGDGHTGAGGLVANEAVTKSAGAVGVGEPAEQNQRIASEALIAQLRNSLDTRGVRNALWLFTEELKKDGAPAVSMDVLRLMFPIVARNYWSSTARLAIELGLERKYDLGTGAYNCGLHALSRGGNGTEVAGYLERMWSLPQTSNPNAASYNYMIGSYMYGGDVDAAFDVLKVMKDHMIYPTSATYHALVTGCIRRRDSRRAYQTLLAVEQQRFDVSAMTIAQVLVASANNDDHDQVMHMLTKLEDSLQPYAEELHRIAEYRSLYRMPDAARTTKVERAAVRGEPKPEIGALAAVFHSAFRGGRIDIANQAWGLFHEFYSELEMPPHFWYCMIGAYAGAGELGRALDIVGAMRESGLEPSLRELGLPLIRPLAYDVNAIDEQFYRLCDRAAGKESILPSAEASKAGLAEGGVSGEPENDEEIMTDPAPFLDDGSPSGDTNVDEDPEAKDLSSESDPAVDVDVGMGSTSAEEITEERSENSENSAQLGSSLADALLQPETSTTPLRNVSFEPKTVGIEEVNCIISACSIAQDLNRAFQTFDEVESRFGLKRNVDTYDALLEGCVQSRRLAGGMRVLEEMENVGLPVGGQTVQLAARLMLRSGELEGVTQLVEKAISSGNKVPLTTFQMVLRHAVRGGHDEIALRMVQLGEGAGLSFKKLIGRFDYTTMLQLRLIVYGEPLPEGFTPSRGSQNRGRGGRDYQRKTDDDDVEEAMPEFRE